MDAVWLILDSLSAESTPFVEGGAQTMPELQSLAAEKGVVFTQAYVPGPASPSSHGSFLTGERPRVTEMHEASPFFEKPEMQTIAGVLDEHESLIISSNPFIFNGLDRDFDHIDDLRNSQYLLFDEASDPGRIDEHTNQDSLLKRYASFILKDGKPVRSFVNGISYKLWQRRQDSGIPKHAPHDDIPYQYTETMNRRIRQFRALHESTFVLANYMDVHPPLDVSDAALDRFAQNRSREDLPIGVRGRDIYERVQNGDTQSGEMMNILYEAAIWDLDRKITPFIESLVDEGTFVIVTADHGSWFRRSRELDDRRLHVPLILFAQTEPARTVSSTVNLRSLPRTTMEILTGESGEFFGPSLFEITEDQLSLTEFVHSDTDDPGPVDVRGHGEERIIDIAAVKGNARVDLLNGNIETIRGTDSEIDELRSILSSERKSEQRENSEGNIEYDDVTTKRLQELGYIE